MYDFMNDKNPSFLGILIVIDDKDFCHRAAWIFFFEGGACVPQKCHFW